MQIGQGALNYTSVAEDVGKYLIFEVIPVAATGAPVGSAVWAVSGSGSNAPPVATNVTITGTPAVGQVLQGVYQYSDLEGDLEGGTTFVWYRSTDGNLDGGDTPVGAASSYEVQVSDAGKTLFFQVTPRAATGSPVGSATATAGVLVSSLPPSLDRKRTLVEENFGGAGGPLQGTLADYLDAAIAAAGGSGTWAAGVSFLDNGTVNIDATQPQNGAYLNLGSYINDAKGTANGKFDLTLAISETTANWISLGFTTQNAPSTTKNFTDTGSGVPTTGIATIVHRSTTSGSGPNELDAWGGPLTANAIPGPACTGTRIVTVSLDFTPAGGWNGTSNFGKVTFSDSIYGTIGSHTYTANNSFGALFISEAAFSGGMISGLTLAQVLSPTLRITLNGENLDLEWGSLAGKVYDLVSSTNLSTPLSTWPTWNGRTNIPSSGATTTLTNVPGGGPVRFYGVIEK